MKSVEKFIDKVQDKGEKFFSPDTWLERHPEAGGGNLRKTFIRRCVGLAVLSGGGFAAIFSAPNISNTNAQLATVGAGVLAAVFGAGFSQRNYSGAKNVKRRDAESQQEPSPDTEIS